MLSVPVMDPCTADPGGNEIFAVTTTSSTRMVMFPSAPPGGAATPGGAKPATISAAPSAMLSGTRILALIPARPLVLGTQTRPAEPHIPPAGEGGRREAVM
ncbi:hypothetical protein GCM10017772_17810 [Promicromonospora soli]|uniref:Uncharacterized protein n=1 Tax=Promicromonospora soli TaxID=2035533 RepID=A0A919KSD2_9MICO|nr:hypothetical protein GCM10017772_17810 [Promicromonospora soli]